MNWYANRADAIKFAVNKKINSYAMMLCVLAEIEQNLVKDRLLAPHYTYYVREMKILAYTQLLESYRSLTLQYMANAFGVSVDFIDRSVSQLMCPP